MALHLLHYADLEVAHDDPEQIGKLSGLVNELSTSETIVCGSGDNIGPSVLSMISQGKQSLDFFQAVDADFDTFGNHDFDHGIEPLLDIVEDSPQTWACANAIFDETRFSNNQEVVPWKVMKKGDDQIGIIGVSHPNTAEINPNASPVEFRDPIPAIESAVNELREREVDWIVVLSHLGEDSQVARQTDVDVILGGHYHDPLVEHTEGTLICRPGGTARNLLEVCVN
jgi:2',3'-cyclic-nucleotide 2'-phosphodiesterase (5'-nucleotidase family)